MFVQAKEVEMSTVAAVSNSREALLGPAAQRLEIGLLAARAAAVLRRVEDRLELDVADEAALDEAHDMVSAAADAVEFIGASGHPITGRKSFGFGAMAFAVELTAPTVPTDDLAEFLRRLAGDLERVRTSHDISIAHELLPAFSTLADVATREAGSVGEGGGSLT
jgi:hypothetical protein